MISKALLKQILFVNRREIESYKFGSSEKCSDEVI